ncbi:MAG: SDR family oxidoreductase [Puniceicoccales bacterium]|nr:SDR family oxidoreductase [Puniceicoccales bacterium]
MGLALVAGGSGFLGSHLCAALVRSGQEVLCIDNHCTGCRENIRALLPLANFSYREQNVALPFSVDGKIDQIYNLACPASPATYGGKNAIFTTKTCVLGAIHLLDLAKVHGATILQASTSEVYGDPTVHPQSESYRGNVNCIGVRACYDEGKRCAESLFFDYHRSEGVDIRVVRIFNTYGPNMVMNDGRVVSNFICQALLGKDVTVFGDGAQTRSFCYVDDCIDCMRAAMASGPNFTGPVNCGNPVEISIGELARMVVAKTESPSRIVFCQLPADDPFRRCPDISLARQRLGWSPRISLKNGLDRTIAYFRAKLFPNRAGRVEP